jgi:hypothetical protein
MKRIALLTLLFACSSLLVLGQQTIPTPKFAAMFTSSNGTGNPGTWTPLAGSGGSTIPYTPPLSVAMMYSTDGTGNPGTWAFCTATTCGGGGGSGVTSVSGTANQIDVANGTTTPIISFDAAALASLGGAPLASPTFTGTVTIPGGASISGYLTSATAASTYAPLASPTFTGTVTIPTGAALATPASGVITNLTGTCTACTANAATTAGNLSGTPALPSGTTATTQASTDNTTKLATDAFVQTLATVSTWNNSQVGAVTTAEGTAPTTNQIRVASVYVPQPFTVSNLAWSVTTADNSTNTYDFGLYGPGCQAGATSIPLVAHLGSTLGSTFAGTTGRNHGAITGGPVTGAAGYYCLAWTSGGATPAAVLGGATASNYAPFAVATAVSQTSTGGALPSTITAPATALTVNSPIVFVQVY